MLVSGNSYWDGTGKFQMLYDHLNSLIPAEGACEKPRGANRKLDKLRRAANAYYDIFNNGGMNRGAEIRHHFGVAMSHYRIGRGREQRTQWARIAAKVDPIMDDIIVAAAVEQKIIDAESAVATKVLVS